MKKYKISVNNKIYEVEIEELENDFKCIQSTKNIQSKQKDNSCNNYEEGEVINAPLPGNVIDIRVKEGEKVKEGQVLMLIEAMKLENEILSPRDGEIISINVNKGQDVTTGYELLILK